jgi:hypothetical protein
VGARARGASAALSFVLACVPVMASACQPSAQKIRAQRDDPAKPAGCTGHVVAADVPSGWRGYPVVADSGPPTLIDVVDEGEGRREVDEVMLDRFIVRYARAPGAVDGGTNDAGPSALASTRTVGLLEVRERTCGEARIVFRPEWSGGALHLRRRVLDYVVTCTSGAAGDASSETPVAAFQWVRDPPPPP